MKITKIVLTAAAIVFAMGSAFTGSDHYSSNNANQPVAPAASVDHAITGSVKTSGMAEHKVVDTKTTIIWPEPGQGIWG